NKDDVLVNRTTSDRAFDAVALAAVQKKYGGLAGLNKEWGTRFPAPPAGSSDREQWLPLLAVVSETRSVPEPTEKTLNERLGSIERANERWGSQTGWGSPDRPAGFKSWAEVITFLNRFYHELSQVRS